MFACIQFFRFNYLTVNPTLSLIMNKIILRKILIEKLPYTVTLTLTVFLEIWIKLLLWPVVTCVQFMDLST